MPRPCAGPPPITQQSSEGERTDPGTPFGTGHFTLAIVIVSPSLPKCNTWSLTLCTFALESCICWLPWSLGKGGLPPPLVEGVVGLGESALAEADLRTAEAGAVEGGTNWEMEGVEVEVARRGEVARLVGVDALDDLLTGCVVVVVGDLGVMAGERGVGGVRGGEEGKGATAFPSNSTTQPLLSYRI